MITEKSDRADAFVQLYRDGWTKAEIARAFDISRERVRQVVSKRGEPARPVGAERIDPARALEVARRARSQQETARILATGGPSLQRVLSGIGSLPALRRLWHWRVMRARRKYTDAQLIDHMRELGSKLGRAPSANDLRRSGIDPSFFQKHFGGVAAAQALAGFSPRRVGDYKGVPYRKQGEWRVNTSGQRRRKNAR